MNTTKDEVHIPFIINAIMYYAIRYNIACPFEYDRAWRGLGPRERRRSMQGQWAMSLDDAWLRDVD